MAGPGTAPKAPANTTMAVFLLIFFLLLTGYGILIDYYRRAWNAIPGADAGAGRQPAVSVVVAVRNEAGNIPRLLHDLYLQDYPKPLYEVIVVDDHSTDGTMQQVQANNYPGMALRSLALPEALTSKKSAIAAGVDIASGEMILTTDADCRMGPGWIAAMANAYTERQAQCIAAPVRMEGKRSLAGLFQMLDFLTLQGITGASVYKRFHSMCNGANLAYSKAAFEAVDGFSGIDTIPSGDDMLLMHKIYLRYPSAVIYLKNSQAIVTTATEPSWKSFLHQRIRWASKAVHYNDRRIRYVLMLVYATNLCFLVLGLASVGRASWLMFWLLFLLAKIIIEFPFVNAVAKFFGQSSLMMYFPFFQPLHILYTIVAGWLGRFGSYQWKSRTIQNTDRL